MVSDVTPDKRYFIVKGRPWRCTNPYLNEETRQHYVKQLMNARRQVKHAKQSQNSAALEEARSQVHEAKVALGERGPMWWNDDAPDFNRYLVQNSPYANWYAESKCSLSQDLSRAEEL
jgi:hypothetical protein